MFGKKGIREFLNPCSEVNSKLLLRQKKRLIYVLQLSDPLKLVPTLPDVAWITVHFSWQPPTMPWLVQACYTGDRLLVLPCCFLLASSPSAASSGAFVLCLC
jgi:hypothetical protein